jgi:hypothetical protein
MSEAYQQCVAIIPQKPLKLSPENSTIGLRLPLAADKSLCKALESPIPTLSLRLPYGL